MTTATFLPTEDGRVRSFALWPSEQAHLRGRWARQFCRPVTMYSSFLLCLRRYARCFDFHVSLNFVVDNSFRHVFERDAVVRPLCPLANPLCGCFCLGSCPFCVSGLLFFFDETQIWLGDLRVVWLVCVILVCCDLPAFSNLLGLCTNDVFTAYAHVRTEPQCDIGHTRGKKKSTPLFLFVLFFPSNASWLSPGRSTRSAACCTEPVN